MFQSLKRDHSSSDDIAIVTGCHGHQFQSLKRDHSSSDQKEAKHATVETAEVSIAQARPFLFRPSAQRRWLKSWNAFQSLKRDHSSSDPGRRECRRKSRRVSIAQARPFLFRQRHHLANVEQAVSIAQARPFLFRHSDTLPAWPLDARVSIAQARPFLFRPSNSEKNLLY